MGWPELRPLSFEPTWGNRVVRAEKTGSSGRLGPRYGTKVRKIALEVERKLKKRYKCPRCGAIKVKRVSTSIWQCQRCGAKFAGAAYSPSTVVEAPAEAKPAEEES